MESKRLFERINVDLPVEFEFVNFKETHTDELDHPLRTKAVNLSMAGIGVEEFPGLDSHMSSKLLKGEKKVRLGIRLYPDMPPVILFARMIWNEVANGHKPPTSSGCAFIDVSEESFYLLKRYIEDAQENDRASH